MKRLIVALIAALAILPAATAGASLPYVMPIAQSYWQSHYYWPPPCGQPIVWEVNWGGPPSAGGYADPSDCVMEINDYYAGTAGFICMLETHEAGHLLGLGDYDGATWWDPSDFMKPSIDYSPTSVIPPCRW